MMVDFVIQTLNNAELQYYIPEGMILYTNLGNQYAETKVEKWLEDNKIRYPYSRKGTPCDNEESNHFMPHYKRTRSTRLVAQILKKRIAH